jgi:hypothetical protein
MALMLGHEWQHIYYVYFFLYYICLLAGAATLAALVVDVMRQEVQL